MRIQILIIIGTALLLACSTSDKDAGNPDGAAVKQTTIPLNGNTDPAMLLRPFMPESGGLVLERTTFSFSGKDVTGRKYVVPALKGELLQSVFDTLAGSGFVYVDGAEVECEGIKNYESDRYAVSLRYKRSACRTAVNVSFGLEILIAEK